MPTFFIYRRKNARTGATRWRFDCGATDVL